MKRISISPRRQSMLLALLVAFVCATDAASSSELESIVEIMGVEEGMIIADVGAGDGAWAIGLADHVGGSGHVWATEVDRDDVRAIEGRVERQGIDNLTVVLGDQSSTGLPDGCCQAILLRLVYHHFERPGVMRAGLIRALRPGGIVAIIDIAPQSSWRDLPRVPDRGGHGIAPEELIREMTADGFEVTQRRDRWNGDPERYCVVFKR